MRPPTGIGTLLAEMTNLNLFRSIDHLLQLLHGQSTNSLGSWLGLEHAWLLGEVLS